MSIAGVGWPNGQVDNAQILALPGPLLMLSSEHWHYEEAVAEGKEVVYRVVPPLSQRPAVLSWSAPAYAQMIKQQVHNLPITDLIWANELDLNYERGDDEDDFQNLEHRYNTIATFANRLIPILRSMYPSTRIHWPAFTPNKDHGAIDHVDIWESAARKCDVIDFHAYNNLEEISEEHSLYSQAFSDMELQLTEWHCKGDLREESRVLKYLDIQHLKSFFFIYRWDNAPGWWDESYDIENNPPRYDMFMETGEPDMADPNADKPQWKAYARNLCQNRSIPFARIYEPQIQLESGWEHYWADGSIKTSPTGSKGLGQLNPRFYSQEQWEDPYHNLNTSTQVMESYLREFNESDKHALAAYNWGPSNVRGYRDSAGRVHPAWDGTREWRCPQEAYVTFCRVGQMHHYLDTILGTDWSSSPQPVPPQPEPTMPEFHFGFKALADQLGHDVVGDPITEEIDTGEVTYQLTTTGKMEYYQSVNRSYFFQAAQAG